MPRPYDLVVVGGGVIGLATAMELLQRKPALHLCVIEKEDALGAHQSGHNSGVIHSGLYYAPGSLKARNCVLGRKLLLRFLEDHGIPYRLCGKVVVATRPEELGRLHDLFRRGVANGVGGLELIGPERLREIEPHARGVSAIHCPETGIVDYRRVAEAYGEGVQARGGEIRLHAELRSVRRRAEGLELQTSAGPILAKRMVACAGLHADRVARMTGPLDDLRIVPFRGSYYRLAKEKRHLVQGLIYPVPDPTLPFLGVHFTPMMRDGSVMLGPNAVLALAREGYRRRAVDPKDLAATLFYPGLLRLAARYPRVALEELYRDLSRSAFARSLRRYVPAIGPGDLRPAAAGIRAQALTRAGGLSDDFIVRTGPDTVHVLNAPSPGATASLAIARLVADRAGAAFGWDGGWVRE